MLFCCYAKAALWITDWLDIRRWSADRNLISEQNVIIKFRFECVPFKSVGPDIYVTSACVFNPQLQRQISLAVLHGSFRLNTTKENTSLMCGFKHKNDLCWHHLCVILINIISRFQVLLQSLTFQPTFTFLERSMDFSKTYFKILWAKMIYRCESGIWPFPG